MSDMDLFSTVCAIQNLCLAARAEGIGVGWVSILKEAQVKSVFEILEPIKLDPLTVADDSDFLNLIEKQPNVPKPIRLGLRDLY